MTQKSGEPPWKPALDAIRPKDLSKAEMAVWEETGIELWNLRLLERASRSMHVQCAKSKAKFDKLEAELKGKPETLTRKTKRSGTVTRINPKVYLRDKIFKEWR
jgi:hypothetical protein